MGLRDYANSQQLSVDLITADIEAHIISMFSHMKYDTQSAITVRRKALEHNRQQWSLLSHPSLWLICLQRNLEHHLECGHAVCDDCLIAFGEPMKGVEYYYDLNICPLCQTGLQFQARLLPPTCQARFLGIDRGGSGGIISLAFIEELEKTLDLPYPLQEHFDYGIGTSSGKSGSII